VFETSGTYSFYWCMCQELFGVFFILFCFGFVCFRHSPLTFKMEQGSERSTRSWQHALGMHAVVHFKKVVHSLPAGIKHRDLQHTLQPVSLLAGMTSQCAIYEPGSQPLLCSFPNLWPSYFANLHTRSWSSSGETQSTYTVCFITPLQHGALCAF